MQFGVAGRVLGWLSLSLLVFQNAVVVDALELDPTQPSQIREVSKKIAQGLVPQYANVQPDGHADIITGVPGTLTQPPYYWWLCGAMFNELINYWHYTGDDTYNDLVREGMIFQMGEHYDLKPANQSKDEGNDDQLFWAFTMMTAAELKFPDPPADKPGWLTIAQSVFNQLIERWDPECGGGLRWQIANWHSGWDYKNTPSNGGMFQLSARLAKYTGNDTYAQKATETYEWMESAGLIEKDYTLHDGVDIKKGCNHTDELPWSYNYGILIGGAAYMYNYTNGSSVWEERLKGFINKTSMFFPEDKGSVMVEIVCEYVGKCNADQVSFKGYLARWLAIAAELAPPVYDQVIPRLRTSAIAAAKQCGEDGKQCGTKWFQPTSDGKLGVGQHMSALSVITVNLLTENKGLYTANSGGTSKGNPAAGTGAEAPPLPEDYLRDITTADRVGASILTILVIAATIGMGWFMVQ